MLDRVEGHDRLADVAGEGGRGRGRVGGGGRSGALGRRRRGGCLAGRRREAGAQRPQARSGLLRVAWGEADDVDARRAEAGAAAGERRVVHLGPERLGGVA